jgi:hypothetical protein
MKRISFILLNLYHRGECPLKSIPARMIFHNFPQLQGTVCTNANPKTSQEALLFPISNKWHNFLEEYVRLQKRKDRNFR